MRGPTSHRMDRLSADQAVKSLWFFAQGRKTQGPATDGWRWGHCNTKKCLQRDTFLLLRLRAEYFASAKKLLAQRYL